MTPTHDVPTQAGAAGIPVLVYHEMDNGCAPSAPVCHAHDPESVSRTQFASQMAYLPRRAITRSP